MVAVETNSLITLPTMTMMMFATKGNKEFICTKRGSDRQIDRCKQPEWMYCPRFNSLKWIYSEKKCHFCVIHSSMHPCIHLYIHTTFSISFISFFFTSICECAIQCYSIQYIEPVLWLMMSSFEMTYTHTHTHTTSIIGCNNNCWNVVALLHYINVI